MARSRIMLHNLLSQVMESINSEWKNNLYFQPPETIHMNYPCIVYSINDFRTTFADNNPYFHCKRYTVTVIDRNPDSLIPDSVAQLPMCKFDRHFTSDNLHHNVFNLYY